MKLLIIISLFILEIWWNNDRKKELILEKERVCQLNKHCRDNKADQLAELDSIIGPKYIVRSSSGNYFFKGMACLNSCNGHVAGYDWAESNEISSFDDCSSRSNSFTEGCEKYVSENILEEDENDFNEIDDCCQSRYVDC